MKIRLNQKGYVEVIVVAFLVVIALSMVGVGLYFKEKSDKLAAEQKNTNQIAVNGNSNSGTQCVDFKMPEICTTMYVPGYYYDKDIKGCVFDGNGCTKPYTTLQACTKACTSSIITEKSEAPIKETCGNVIVYNVAGDKVAVAQSDCQTRGGTFKECDSPCGSVLTVCQMSCTLSNN